MMQRYYLRINPISSQLSTSLSCSYVQKSNSSMSPHYMRLHPYTCFTRLQGDLGKWQGHYLVLDIYRHFLFVTLQ